MHIDLSKITATTSREIAQWLRPMLSRYAHDPSCEYPLGLRLVCFTDGSLQLLTGNVSFDLHNGIACGIATMEDPRRVGWGLLDLCEELALDLLDQLSGLDHD